MPSVLHVATPAPPLPAEPQGYRLGIAIASVAGAILAEREQRMRQLRDCGVLPEHERARLDQYDQAIQDAHLVMLSGMLIKGSVGTGKTHLAAAICARWLVEEGPSARPKRVRCLLARQLFRRVWSTYRDDASESEEQVIRELTAVDLLVIDDLAHEGRVSAAGIGALHEILSVRIGHERPTVVTTNLSLTEIASHYDAAVASRLGSFEQVTLTGRDRRDG